MWPFGNARLDSPLQAGPGDFFSPCLQHHYKTVKTQAAIQLVWQMPPRQKPLLVSCLSFRIPAHLIFGFLIFLTKKPGLIQLSVLNIISNLFNFPCEDQSEYLLGHIPPSGSPRLILRYLRACLYLGRVYPTAGLTAPFTEFTSVRHPDATLIFSVQYLFTIQFQSGTSDFQIPFPTRN